MMNLTKFRKSAKKYNSCHCVCITIYYSLKSWVQKKFVAKEANSCTDKPIKSLEKLLIYA